jgi:regulator of sirC expression with transglutaminase-like and TPR domain
MAFRDWMRAEHPTGEPEPDLLRGALAIAQDEYPGLDIETEVGRFAELARPLARIGLDSAPVDEQVRVLADHVYGTCGFAGNEAEYYDPRNSYLNDVLDRRLGIPISLAVVYVDAARRVGVNAWGVGFPGHFLVRVEGEGGPRIIDPFNAGRGLDRPALRLLLRTQNVGSEEPLNRFLTPATTRDVLVRMLMNLRGIYAARGDYRRLLIVLDRVLGLRPDAWSELRDRGILAAKLGAPGAAIEDLTSYLARVPEAPDAAEVRRFLTVLKGRGVGVLH